MWVNTSHCKFSKSFTTQSGFLIKSPVVSYEEYGNPSGPVVIVTHGGLSNHHAAGRSIDDTQDIGWWDDLIGPGKALNTDVFRIICPNSFGSMYGTTGPLSVDPESGERYGPRFPDITLIDMVRFLRMFLDELGIQEIHTIAGPSMGGLQALQFAALYPNDVAHVIAVAAAGRMTPFGVAIHHFIAETIKADPRFQDGYYQRGEPLESIRTLQRALPLLFMHQDIIQASCFDSVPATNDTQDSRVERCRWFLLNHLDENIKGRDANSILRILKAVNGFDLGKGATSFRSGVQRIKAQTLLVNFTTDSEFPPSYGREVVDLIKEVNPHQAHFAELYSAWGHIGSAREASAIGEEIFRFYAARESSRHLLASALG